MPIIPCVGCFTAEQFEGLLFAFPASRELLLSEAEVVGRHTLLSYGKLRNRADVSEEIIKSISKLEVYDLPAEMYRDLMLARWCAFADRLQNKTGVVVLECCFLQNALSKLFVQHDVDERTITQYLYDVSNVIKPLNPILVYLNPQDIHETIARVVPERPKEWLDFVVWYHTEQAYGQKHGLRGVEGYIDVLAARKWMEIQILGKLPIRSICVDNPHQNWTAALRKIEECLCLELDL